MSGQRHHGGARRDRTTRRMVEDRSENDRENFEDLDARRYAEPTPEHIAEIEQRYGKTIEELADEAEAGYDTTRMRDVSTPEMVARREAMAKQDPVDLLVEWFTWWRDSDAPAKLPDALQVRTGVLLGLLNRLPE
jgi:hypothetical protein